jgi:hypothetical protein
MGIVRIAGREPRLEKCAPLDAGEETIQGLSRLQRKILCCLLPTTLLAASSRHRIKLARVGP